MSGTQILFRSSGELPSGSGPLPKSSNILRSVTGKLLKSSNILSSVTGKLFKSSNILRGPAAVRHRTERGWRKIFRRRRDLARQQLRRMTCRSLARWIYSSSWEAQYE